MPDNSPIQTILFKFSHVRIDSHLKKQIPKRTHRQIVLDLNATDLIDLPLTPIPITPLRIVEVPLPPLRINLLLKIKSIHLEWLNLKSIHNLEVFTDLHILYLQHAPSPSHRTRSAK
jgi:hypothetical protein